jgi:hypothetical protein
MAVAYVQSTHNAAKLVSSVAKAFTSNNTSGNMLVCCVGVWRGAAFSDPTIADTQGNTWKLLLSTPRQFFNLGGSCAYLFVAYNCVAGANTVTVTVGSSSDIDIAIHEYSGVATVTAMDQIASGAQSTGPSGSVFAGTIQTRYANEVLFSFAYDQTNGPQTFTPTSGWTAREQTLNPDGASMRSFDQLVSATGSYTNTITGTLSSHGLHGIIASFADTSTTDPLKQSAKNATLAASSLTVAFPAANTSGNLLLLAIGRWVSGTLGTISSITDSQGNTWALVGSSTIQTNSGQSQSHLYACASCAAGANTITVTVGSSQDLTLIAAEYTPNVINGDVSNTNHGSTSIASGNLAVDAGLAFALGYNQNYTGGMSSDVSGTGWRNRANSCAAGPFGDDNGTESLSVFDQVVAGASIIEQTLSVSIGSSGLHILVAAKTQTIRPIMEFLIS